MKQITCITCPVGCRITVDVENGDHVFKGNKCDKGVRFALAELTAPFRSLTTMVKTVFPDMPVLSVRTKGEIPKNKISKVIKDLSNVLVTERKGIGDTVVINVSKTGCDVIATSDMLSYAGSKEAC